MHATCVSRVTIASIAMAKHGSYKSNEDGELLRMQFFLIFCVIYPTTMPQKSPASDTESRLPAQKTSVWVLEAHRGDRQ